MKRIEELHGKERAEEYQRRREAVKKYQHEFYKAKWKEVCVHYIRHRDRIFNRLQELEDFLAQIPHPYQSYALNRVESALYNIREDMEEFCELYGLRCEKKERKGHD
jgi:hypothetical protein